MLASLAEGVEPGARQGTLDQRGAEESSMAISGGGERERERESVCV